MPFPHKQCPREVIHSPHDWWKTHKEVAFCRGIKPKDLPMPASYLPHVQCPDRRKHDSHDWAESEYSESLFCSGLPNPPKTITEDSPENPIQLMLERQKKFQNLLYPDFDRMTPELRAIYIKDQVLSLISELHEALDEMGWKAWATSRHFNREAFFAELVDAQCFLLNLFLATGYTPEETALNIANTHANKWTRNIARQSNGYDGVTGKCPHCHRAYDDDAVKCVPRQTATENPFPAPAYCERKGYL